MKKGFVRTVSVLLALLMFLASFGGMSISAEQTLAFDGAAVRAEEGITVYFTVSKEKLADYDSFYMSYSKDGGEAVKVESYTETDDSYSFACEDIAAKEMNSKISATLTATKGSETKTGTALEYSVSEYCYGILGDTSAEQWEKSVAASLLVYGTEAQKYFGYKTDALVSANMTDEQKAMATSVDKNALTSVYENQTKDSAVTITGATVEHGNKPRLVVELVHNTEGETVSGLTARMAWGSNSESVEENEFKEINGKLYVYFDGLTPAELSQTLTISVFRGRSPVSNTVKYSFESYVADKKDDAETSAIALAMLGYGKAVAAMPEKSPCEDGHTLAVAADGYDLVNKCKNCTYTEPLGAKVISFTSENAVSAHGYAETTTFNRGYDATANALKVKLPSAAGDPYLVLKTGDAVDITEYSYIAVYAKSNAAFSMGYQGENNENLNHFNASTEWKSYVIDCAALTGSFGKARINFKEKEAGDTLYINSIAFFKTEAEAVGYLGISAGEVTLDAKEPDAPITTSDILAFTSNESITQFSWAQTLNEFTRTYDSTENALKITVNANNGDPYFVVNTSTALDLTEYNYIVVYGKSTFNGTFHMQREGQNVRSFTASSEYTAWVLDCSALTGNLGVLRINFPANTVGATLYINSIALFKTEAEAQAFTGVFE